MTNRLFWHAVLLLAVACWGCSKPRLGEPRMKTYPVTGVVTVDGEPAAFLEIECHPESDTELKRPVIAVTNTEGRFSIGTYESGDGLPEGSYVLTFKWVEMGIAAVDKLKGAYADPQKSDYKVTVVAGETTDIGEIELSSEGAGKK